MANRYEILSGSCTFNLNKQCLRQALTLTIWFHPNFICPSCFTQKVHPGAPWIPTEAATESKWTWKFVTVCSYKINCSNLDIYKMKCMTLTHLSTLSPVRLWRPTASSSLMPLFGLFCSQQIFTCWESIVVLCLIRLIVFSLSYCKSKIPVFKLMITISKWSNRTPYPNSSKYKVLSALRWLQNVRTPGSTYKMNGLRTRQCGHGSKTMQNIKSFEAATAFQNYNAFKPCDWIRCHRWSRRFPKLIVWLNIKLMLQRS